MFVGHALLAFALVAGLADHLGAGRQRALAVGLLAAGFATVPDVDVLHPLVVLAADPLAPTAAPGAFWELSTEIHRAATHSLVVGAVTALGATAWAARRGADPTSPRRLDRLLPAGAVAVLAGLVAVVGSVDGSLAAAVVALMALAGLALAELARRAGLGVAAVGAAAVVGLLTHPFGDLFTGQPPPLFYPLGVDVLAAQVRLHPDPTLHLVGAFLAELATVWLALAVLARLYGVRLGRRIRLRSTAGVGYAGAAVALPAPSLDAATPFVVSVLAVGLLGAAVPRPDRADRWQVATTALVAVTLAAVAFGVTYALV